jgi:hypothetical protein
MSATQTYNKKASARRAALADLGKSAREGVDYGIVRLPDGRYVYERRPGHIGAMSGRGADPYRD